MGVPSGLFHSFAEKLKCGHLGSYSVIPWKKCKRVAVFPKFIRNIGILYTLHVLLPKTRGKQSVVFTSSVPKLTVKVIYKIRKSVVVIYLRKY